MRVIELKAPSGDRRLRNYSQMRKAELVVLLQNNDPLPSQRALQGPAVLPGNLWTMIGNRGPPPNKKWIYLNNKK